MKNKKSRQTKTETLINSTLENNSDDINSGKSEFEVEINKTLDSIQPDVSTNENTLPLEDNNDMAEKASEPDLSSYKKNSSTFFSDKENRVLFSKQRSFRKILLSSFSIIVVIFATYYLLSSTSILNNFHTVNLGSISNFFANKLKSPLSNFNVLTLNLTIQKPDDEIIVFKKNLEIQGQTLPKALIIITLNNQQLEIEADESGQFLRSLNLSYGLNEITISAFDDKGNSKVEERTVYYSEEKI